MRSLRQQSTLTALTEAEGPSATPRLRKRLNPWQIFFIAVSGLVGTGVFSGNGSVLKTAGPGGYLLSLGVIGIIALAFMDSLSELVQAFPCSNALSEYVDIFVDPELATIVAIAYWSTWGIYWASMVVAAASYANSWDPGVGVIVAVFFIITPAVMVGINLLHVSVFGWIETIGGMLKTIAIVAVSLAIYYLAGQLGKAPDYIREGFIRGEDWHTQAINVCSVLPMVAYSWIGLEIVAVTAFEAKHYTDLRVPSQALPYFILGLYFVCAVGESLAIPYNAPLLPHAGKRDEATVSSAGTITSPLSNTTSFRSTALVIIAATQIGRDRVAQGFNSVLIFSALSAGNTCLYVASRTLYGFAFNDRRRNSSFLKRLSWVNKYGVPKYAVLATALVFGWLPFLSLGPGNESIEFAEWLNTVASLSGIFVWAAVCLAYIRYWHWLHKFKDQPILTKHNPGLNRFDSKTKKAHTLFSFAQPGPAYLGFVGSMLILLLFPSSIFWQRPASPLLVTQTFFFTFVAFGSWLILKFRRYLQCGPHKPFEWYTVWPDDAPGLQAAFDKLVLLSGYSASYDVESCSVESSIEVEEVVVVQESNAVDPNDDQSHNHVRARPLDDHLTVTT